MSAYFVHLYLWNFEFLLFNKAINIMQLCAWSLGIKEILTMLSNFKKYWKINEQTIEKVFRKLNKKTEEQIKKEGVLK